MQHLKLGQKILAITAHPDDESYLMASLLIQNQAASGRNFLICATLGEKGTPKFKRAVSPAQLKNIRKQELLKASKFLRIAKLKMAGLPDGQVAQHQTKFFAVARKFAETTKPNLLVSFGRDGISAHRDHIAAAKVAAKLAKVLQVSLLCATLPPKAHNRAYVWLKKRRKALHYHHQEILHPYPNVMVPVHPAAKLKALRFHRSQVDPHNPFHGFSKIAAREFWKAEYFVLKRP